MRSPLSGMWTLALAAALAVPAVAAGPPHATPVIEGSYRSSSDGSLVVLTLLKPGYYHAHSDAWDGVGMFDGAVYLGVFRMAGRESTVAGTHVGKIQADGSFAIRSEFANGGKAFDAIWKRSQEKGVPPQPGPPPPLVVTPPSPDADPKLGEYVYIEELPEAITKVPPKNPPCVSGGFEGTVIIQALVGTDGRVKDTKVVKSIPCLDEAAVQAVRQWIFKPAMAKGSPVAVWVAVPVRFTAKA